ncbi:hypothetical protein CVT26_015281 [Gymnopilus dilepis]|uniref:Uncharacterized protein n=1 Tax=Gymnopilus dilepis TaxID=231916 RepID=A0A409X9A8_9AGAR|nr:hypothetical protein CVT26_015281 [Gymnopilus dilepis]
MGGEYVGECKVLGQPEVTARTTTPVHSNLTITSSQVPSLIPPPALPSQAGIPPGTTNSVVISSQAPLNALPQAVHEHSATPSQVQQPRAVVPNVAQPIHDQMVVHPAPAPFPMPPPNVKRHNAALAKTASVKTLKVQQHEIEEQKKRTVTLIIWHKNGQPPVRLERHIISYPHLRLSDYPDLMDELSLQSNARIDVWQGSEWVTMAPSGVIGVEKELDKELDRQQKRNPTTLGLKRLGENFVSPIRKTARVDDAATVHSSQASLASSQALLSSSRAVSIPSSDDKVVLSVKPATVTSAPGDSRPLPSISLIPVAGPVDTPSTNSLPGVPAASCINVCAPQADFVPDSKDVRSQKKQWPHDFYVYEIHDGIALINQLTKQRPGHRKLKVEEAFRQAFPGVKWASSTYYDNKKIWDAQDPADTRPGTL